MPKPYRVGDDWYQPLPHARAFKQKGVASWYGKDFHGKRTSSGETYDMYAMTAAHKILPLGVIVRVENLDNGKQTVVRINDRGPFVRGRIIDLSYAAAKELGVVGPGTARVEIEALGTSGASGDGSNGNLAPVDCFNGNFTVQVGAFQNRDNALRLKEELARAHSNAHVVVHDDGNKTLYRVRVGRYDSLTQVMAAEKRLVENGYPKAFSVAE